LKKYKNKKTNIIQQPGYLFYGIALSALAFYLYIKGISLWWVVAAAFIALGSFGLATEKPRPQEEDTVARDTPGIQRYKTTIPKFKEIKKLKNGEMKLDEIKKRYEIIAEFYKKYKFNLYKDISNRKIAQKQMEDIVNVVDKNLIKISLGTSIKSSMLISGMIHLKFVKKKRVIKVNNDLKEMHDTGERIGFDVRLMTALESILGI
jgi:hypothetical protein